MISAAKLYSPLGYESRLFSVFLIIRLIAHSELEAGALAQLAVADEVGAVSPAVEVAIFRVRF